MSDVAFTNQAQIVQGKITQFGDLLMGLMAAKIETNIKTSGNTPVDKGNLRSSARSVKIGQAHYQVEDTQAYAAAQEVGYRHTKSGQQVDFVNHPKGGGKGYFSKAIEAVTGSSAEYIRTAQEAVGLETA